MKSERRHDLETNQLAIQVQDFLDRVKPYASQIALVIVGLLALAYIGSLWRNSSAKTEQDAWDAYTVASYSSDPELNSMKLLAENEEYSGTAVAEWAYLAWADRQLLLASQTYLTNRESTDQRLGSALEIYRNLAEDSTVTQVQDRARYGLAQVLEMQGEVEKAREAYSRVKGDLAASAKDRAKQLESNNVQEAVNWLATAELPKRPTPSTSGATTGARPSFDAETPATTPAVNPLDDTRTLEEILGGSPETSTESDRYGEEGSEDAAAPEASQETGNDNAGETNADDSTDSTDGGTEASASEAEK